MCNYTIDFNNFIIWWLILFNYLGVVEMIDTSLQWCKTYDVLHTIKYGNKFIQVWDRLTFCKFCCNRTKIEFWNAETMKRCRLSLNAIKVICDDMYKYNQNMHNNLIEKLKGGTI